MGIDVIFRIAAVGVIVAVLEQLLSRSGRGEYTLWLSVGGLIAAVMMLLPYVVELFRYLREVFGL